MYDVDLLEDLKEYKKGLDNIYEYEYMYKLAQKVIKCRTKDKIYILDMLLTASLIDKAVYEELYNRVQSDYRRSYKYLFGFCQI